MTHTSAFKTPEGEVAYLAAYETALRSWPIPYEEIELPTRFGLTHIIACGPQDAPPLVLLHGYMVTSAMWLPNIADFSKNYRVFAIDVMGQPGKSIYNPDEPIRVVADFIAWLNETLNTLNLEWISLVGMSYGGWLALNLAINSPERIHRLALLSPAACFQPLVSQFALRGMLMGFFPTRLTTNSLMGWMGYKDTPGDTFTHSILDLFYLGIKHFRLPREMMQLMPNTFSDDELRALRVPVLLLIGENEVIYNASKALERASQLIPNLQGELVPGCKHDMCSSQHQIVDTRVLDFLNKNGGGDTDSVAT